MTAVLLATVPNHPEALLSFFSLFPSEEKLVLFGFRPLVLGKLDAPESVKRGVALCKIASSFVKRRQAAA